VDGEVVARWRWVYDYDNDPPGGFVFGHMTLDANGVLLRSYGESEGPWRPVPWWPGERDPRRAAEILAARGYELRPT
jgi:hypothetical protein